ncbi:DgyrCDS6414 [Dimorphilus gyrociliatus]|uniref:DgyrCDS6414 n=1 Tax=Dimorphilus gyrociliatus TaxID=2664684 RepID=A0A7I8VQS6_9ANNE|nr:DgyrCDS6414 [Dimorphilus gyrociliatus]
MGKDKEKERNAPKDIKFDCLVMDVDCHPDNEILTTADIDGNVKIFKYSTTGENEELNTLTHHKKSCRRSRFLPNGEKFVTCSKDKSMCVIDTSTYEVVHTYSKSHKSPIYSLCIIDDNIIASGDDDGTLKLWDLRKQKSVMEMKECEEFISDMVIDESKKILLATSGEGTLTTFDVKKHKMRLQSELFESEFLSITALEDKDKVVVGDGDGVLNIFNKGEWSNISDRFPGHPMSIDCLVTIHRNLIVTGCMDGKIRAVNILPNNIVEIVGKHNQFPIESLSLTHCQDLLVSCSHDQKIKFWNISHLYDLNTERPEEVKAHRKTKKQKFFDDL